MKMDDTYLPLFFCGKRFVCFKNLSDQIEKYEEQNKCKLFIQKTRKITSCSRKASTRSIKDDLVYHSISYACIRSGRGYQQKSRLKRKSQTCKNECPFHLKLAASMNGQTLEVKSFNAVHNHEITLEPSQKNLSDDIEMQTKNTKPHQANKKLIQSELFRTTEKSVLADLKNSSTKRNDKNIDSNISARLLRDGVDGSDHMGEQEIDAIEKSAGSVVAGVCSSSSDVQSIKTISKDQSKVVNSTAEIFMPDKNISSPIRIQVGIKAKVSTPITNSLVLKWRNKTENSRYIKKSTETTQMIFPVEEKVAASVPCTEADKTSELGITINDRSTIPCVLNKAHVIDETLQQNNAVEDSVTKCNDTTEQNVQVICSIEEEVGSSVPRIKAEEKDMDLKNKIKERFNISFNSNKTSLTDKALQENNVYEANAVKEYGPNGTNDGCHSNLVRLCKSIGAKSAQKNSPVITKGTDSPNSMLNNNSQRNVLETSVKYISKKESDDPNIFSMNSNPVITNVISVQDIITPEECENSDSGSRIKRPQTSSNASEIAKQEAIRTKKPRLISCETSDSSTKSMKTIRKQNNICGALAALVVPCTDTKKYRKRIFLQQMM